MLSNLQMEELCSQFNAYGYFMVGVPFGSGHINDTYQVTYDQGGTRLHYTLQRINHHVFRQPELLMENMVRITRHIKEKIIAQNKQLSKRTLELLHTKSDGKPYVKDKDGNYYRMYVFVEGAHAFDFIETPKQAYAASRAFGGFIQDLTDLPGGRLHETIPDFHNTKARLEMFKQALKADVCNRAGELGEEIDFVLSHEEDAEVFPRLLSEGVVHEVITHNDTKLNNVLIDDSSGKGVCITDLDTVMPGLAHYDFGDMIRTGATSADEDEINLDKVGIRMDFFEAILTGFCRKAGSFLSNEEMELLPFGGKLITYEIGVRFLTDYLNGDKYFKIHRPRHNLDRARNQFKLVKEIEKSFDEMQKLLKTAKK